MPGGAQVDCGDAKTINSLGGSNRFSEPITSIDGLQTLFTEEREDIATLLRQAGFSGNIDDLSRAASSARAVEIQPGERMGWMFMRKGGRTPDLLENVCWAGREAFKGWEIQFSSDGTWYSFVVPEVCGNVAHLAEVAEPECRVQVTDSAGTTCASTGFTIDARGSTGELSLEVSTPSGRRQTLSASQASSPGRWTFEDPARRGDFTFTVVGSIETPRGNTLECRASETLSRNCCELTAPGITLSATSQVVEPGETVTVTANPTVSDCAELESVTIGGQTVSGRPYTRELTWDTPGAYVVTGTVNDSEGQSASGEVTVRVAAPVVVAPTTGWTLRGFAGPVVDVGDSETSAFPSVVDGELERRHYMTDRGAGLGIELERRFNSWFGLGLVLCFSRRGSSRAGHRADLDHAGRGSRRTVAVWGAALPLDERPFRPVCGSHAGLDELRRRHVRSHGRTRNQRVRFRAECGRPGDWTSRFRPTIDGVSMSELSGWTRRLSTKAGFRIPSRWIRCSSTLVSSTGSFDGGWAPRRIDGSSRTRE